MYTARVLTGEAYKPTQNRSSRFDSCRPDNRGDARRYGHRWLFELTRAVRFISASRPDAGSVHTSSMVERQTQDLEVAGSTPAYDRTASPTRARQTLPDGGASMMTTERDLRLEMLNSLLTTPH